MALSALRVFTVQLELQRSFRAHGGGIARKQSSLQHLNVLCALREHFRMPRVQQAAKPVEVVPHQRKGHLLALASVAIARSRVLMARAFAGRVMFSLTKLSKRAQKTAN
jgi:hypothetical protein